MQTPFRHNLVWSAVGHVGLLLLIGALVAFAPVRKLPEMIQVMDLAPDLGSPAPGPVNPPAPPASVPDPEPLPAPPSPTPPEPQPPQPETVPPEPRPAPVLPKPPTPKPNAITEKPSPKTPEKRETPKPSLPRVVVNTNKVVRVVRNPAPALPRTTGTRPAAGASSGGARYDPKAFSRRLLKQMEGSGGLITAEGATETGTGGAGQPSPFAWYFNRIFVEMYAAWQPPFGLDEGLRAQVLIRVEKNGTITKVSLATPSGNQAMDDSALAAANRVKNLPPLPEGLGGSFAEITVHFKVQRP